eukprot:5373198-Alexandrium_andersonii.AAC.1
MVPTSDPQVDREKAHHIGGPSEISYGFEFPSEFGYNWLRPAPQNREIFYADACRKWQANLCGTPGCHRAHVCA